MKYSHRYRAYPEWTNTTSECEQHINIARQLYNHVKHDYTNSPDENKPSKEDQNNKLPNWKKEWNVFSNVYSKVAEEVVRRFHNNLSRLADLKANEYKVGRLQHKNNGEYQSITYVQSGFEVENKTDRTDYRTLELSKIGDIPIRYHRPIPDNATIKEVTLKQEASGAWYVSFNLELDDEKLPEKTPVDELDEDNIVGIDLGVSQYVHTSDGISVGWLDLEDEYEQVRSAQQDLSRKQHGSNNWDKQREELGTYKRHIKEKVLDFQHKLSTWLVKTYDAVCVEDLNVKSMLEGKLNARNMQSCAWSRFIDLLEYKGKLYGSRIVKVKPEGTTKECSQCGIETEKPLWVREHSCPSCGFTLDRDWNASLNVLYRGLNKLGVGDAEQDACGDRLPAGDGSDTSESVTATAVIEARSLRA